jgi:hypothetical protein
MIQSFVASIPMLLTHNRLTKDFGLGAVQGQPALFPHHSDFWLERVIQSGGQITGGLCPGGTIPIRQGFPP